MKKPWSPSPSGAIPPPYEVENAVLVRRGPGRTVHMTLALLRESTGLTQVQVAKKMGVNKQAVSEWESMTTIDFTVRTLRRYLSAIGVDLELVAVSKYGHRIGIVGKTKNGGKR